MVYRKESKPPAAHGCGVRQSWNFEATEKQRLDALGVILTSRTVTDMALQRRLVCCFPDLLLHGLFGRALEEMGGNNGITRLGHLPPERARRVSLAASRLKGCIMQLSGGNGAEKCAATNEAQVNDLLNHLEVSEGDRAHVLVHMVGTWKGARGEDYPLYALANYASSSNARATGICEAIEAYVRPLAPPVKQ